MKNIKGFIIFLAMIIMGGQVAQPLVAQEVSNVNSSENTSSSVNETTTSGVESLGNETTEQQAQTEQPKEKVSNAKSNHINEIAPLAQTNGAVTVDIPDYNAATGWTVEETKNVNITVDFNETTSTNREIRITLPQGMRFTAIPVSVLQGGDYDGVEVEANTILKGATTSVQMPGKQTYPTINNTANFSGELVYKLNSGLTKIELQGLQITVDGTAYYGPKEFTNAINVTAVKNGAVIGNVTQAAKVKLDDYKVALYQPNGNNNRRIEEATTDKFELNEFAVSRIGYLNGKPTYRKDVEWTFYYPKGFTFEGTTNNNYKVIENNEAEGKVTFHIDEMISSFRISEANSIKLSNQQNKPVGTYTASGPTLKVTEYDGTISNYDFTANKQVVEVLSSDDPLFNNKLDLKGDNGGYMKMSNDYSTHAPYFGFTTPSYTDKKNQVFEYIIDPEYEVERVTFPSTIRTGITEIIYQTNLQPGVNKTATANQIISYDGVTLGLYKLGIDRKTLSLQPNEYITYARAFVGTLPANITGEFTSVKYTKQAKISMIGHLIDGVSAADVTVNTWSESSPGVETAGTRSSLTKSVTRGTAKSVFTSTMPAYNMVAGTTKKVDGYLDIGANQYAYTPVLAIINPTIYLRQPEGVMIDASSLKFMQGSTEIIPNNIEEYVVSSTGEKVIKVELEMKIGRYFEDSAVIKPRLDYTYAYIADATASGNYTWNELVFFETTNGLQPSYGQIALQENKYDVLNDGNTSLRLATPNSKAFDIIPNKILAVDTYIVPEGETRKPPYNSADPSTAVGFTPGTKADYVVALQNNREESVNAFVGYIPVPKDGMDFGSQFQDGPFTWNMRLDATSPLQVEVYDADGNPKPGDIPFYSLEFSSDEKAANFTTSNFLLTGQTVGAYGGAVKNDTVMIRIKKSTPILPGERAVVKGKYIVDETSATAAGKLGGINTFRPYYYFNAGSAGFLSGTMVGAVLEIGEFSGYAFLDKNHNGIKDAGDEPLVNKPVNVYVKNAQGDYQLHPKSPIYTDPTGRYSIDGLGSGVFKLDFNGVLGTGQEFSKYSEVNLTDITSNVPVVGEKKGIIEDIVPTNATSANLSVGVLEYNPPVDFVITNDATKTMKASNTQHTITTDLPLKIDPTFYEYIAPDTDAVVWTTSNPAIVNVSGDRNKATLTAGQTNGATQTATITVTVKDIYGNVRTRDTVVTVQSNDIPTITGKTIVAEKGAVFDPRALSITINDTEDGSIALTHSKVQVSTTVPTDASNVVTTTGTYDVTYTYVDTDDNTVTGTYVVVVFDKVDNVNKVGWNGHDFHIDVASANTTGFISAGEVKAFDISDTNTIKPITPITSNPASLYAGIGQSVEFQAGGSKQTWIANVYDRLDETNKVGWIGHDFYIAVANANTTGFINAGEVKAYNVSNALVASEIVGIITNPASLPVGQNQGVEYQAASSTYSLTAHVFDEIDKTNEVGWNGHDFSIAVGNANTSGFINAGEVKAFDVSDIANITEIKPLTTNPTTLGVGLSQTVEYQASASKHTQLAHVFDEFDEANKVGWNGHDFEVELGNVATVDMIDLAGVKAYDTSAGTPTEYAKADITKNHTITTVGNGQTVTYGLTSNPSTHAQKANVFNHIDEANKVGWNGHNFDFELKNIGSVDMVDLSEVEAFDLSIIGNPSSYTKTDITTSHAITTVGNDQLVTFGLKTNPSTHEQKANVFDEIDKVNKVAWNGNDFNVALGDVATADMVALADVKAFDTSVVGAPTAYPASSITTNHTITAVGNGQSVTFGLTANPSTRGQKANVFTTYDSTAKIGMNATDFTLPFSQVKEAKYKEASGVSAWNVANASDPQEIGLNEITVDSSYTYPTGAKAAHPVKFVTSKGGEVEVNVTIIATNIDLDADSFSITLAEAKTIDKDAILSKSHAVANSNNAGAAGTEILTVDAAVIQVLNDLTTSNTVGVPVEITVTDTTNDKTSLTIKVYVFDEIDKTNKVGWNGHDFEIELGNVATADMISYADVTAFNLTNDTAPSAYAKTDITVTHDIATTGNDQVVTFGLKANPSKHTQNANVFDAWDKTNKVGWNGHNFDMQLSDVGTADMIDLAGVEAFDTSVPGAPVAYLKTDITANHTITTVGINQSVIFGITANPSTHGQKANVFDTIDKTNKIGWNGHNFDMQIGDVVTADMIGLADIQAFDISNVGTPSEYAKADIKINHDITTIGNNQLVTFGLKANASKREQRANVFDELDEVNKVGWNGHNFDIQLNDVASADMIDLASIQAFDTTIEGAPVAYPKADISPTHTITTTGNDQPVIYSLDSNPSRRAQAANVFDTIDKVNKVAWNGHDFNIALKDVTTADMINYAGVTAFDITNAGLPSVYPKADITVAHAITITGNAQPVTFGLKANPSEKGYKANVFDVFDSTTKIGMNATDFTLPLSQVSEARYKEASGVNAWSASDASNPQEVGLNLITVDPSYTYPAEAKVADLVKFFTPDGTSIQVHATIIATNIDLDAHSISITLAEAKTINATTLLSKTGAIATSNNAGGAGTETVEADSVAIEALNNLVTANTAGVPVEITAKDTTPDETSLTIKVYVFDSIDETNKVGWDGHNFEIELNQVPSADMIHYANITAFDITDASAPSAYAKTDITTDHSITTTGNNQTVTFGLKTNPSTREQKANVFDKWDEINNVGWNGHNFDFELRNLDSIDMIDAATIEAFDTTVEGAPVVYPKSDITVSHTITTIGNNQTVTYGLTSNPSIREQKANVFDDIDETNNIGWNGHDFNIALKDVKNADLIQRAGVTAFDITATGAPKEIAKAEITTAHGITTTGNGQAVTYGLRTNPSTRERKANVFDVFDTATNEGMNATDFTLPLSQVSEARYKEASGVNAWDTTDASNLQAIGLTDITVDPSYTYPTAAKTEDPVKFFTPAGTFIQVNAKIIETNIDLDADSISITLAEAQTIDETKLLAKTKAVAVSNNAGGAGTETITADSTAIQTLNDLTVSNTIGIPVEITAKDTTPDETSLTIKVYVFDDIDEVNKVGWNGHNFEIELHKVATADMIHLAGVTVSDITNPAAPSAYAKADITVSHTITTTGNGQNVTFGLKTNPSKREQKANVFDKWDETNNVGWNGHNFDIELVDVPTADMIEKADVEAFDTTIKGTPVEYPKADITVNHTITAIGNNQPITYGLTSNASTHKENANVFDEIDETNKVAWNGHDFNIALKDVPTADMIHRAGVTAFNTAISGEPKEYAKADIKIDHAITATGNGQTVTFGIKGNASTRDRKANVFDIFDTTTSVGMNATDFTLPLSQVSETRYKEASGVNAWDAVNASDPQAIKLDDITVDAAYVYPTAAKVKDPVKFVTPSGTSIQVNATIIDTNLELNAHSISITLAEAQTMDETTLLTRTGAIATSNNAGGAGTETVGAEATAIQTLKDLTAANTVGIPVEITARDTTPDETSLTIKVYVFDEIDNVNNVGWNGHNFEIELKNVATADMINLAGITAFDITNESTPSAYAKADITIAHTITATGNDQPITFGLKTNPSKRGQRANVFDMWDKVNNVGWNGHNFEFELKNIDSTDMIGLAGVEAFDTTIAGTPVEYQKVDITVNHTITTIGNNQPVTYGLTSNLSTHEQKANVFDEIDVVNGIAWNGNNFNIALKDVATADMISRASVTAFNTSTVGAPKEIAKADITTTHNITAVGNGQTVTYGLKANPSTRDRKANVFDTYDATTKVGMNATNFTLPLSQVSEARYKEASNVNAWDATDAGDPQEIGLADITVDPTYTYPVAAKTADPVKFFTPAGTFIQVNAKIIDTNIALDAHSISITLADAQAIDETTLLARTEATAVSNNVGGAGTESITADAAAIQTIKDLTTPNTAGIPVEITAKDTTPDETSLTVKVYVFDSIDDVNHVGWNGHNFEMELRNVAKADMIHLAGVTAFNITNEAAPSAYAKADITVEHTIITTGNGQVVTYGLRSNPSKRTQTANVFNVWDEINKVGWNGHAFDIELKDVENADMIDLATVEAFDTIIAGAPVAYPKADITVNHTITAIGNNQPVIYGLTSNPSMHKENANVFDEIDEVNHIAWNGHNFEIELRNVVKADMINYAGIRAFDTSVVGAPVEYAKATITTEHTISTTGNDQVVTFGLKSNPSKRAQKANVFDEWDKVNNVGWNGHAFDIKLTDVDIADMIDLGIVEAFDTSVAGVPVAYAKADMTVNHTITTIGNNQPVTFGLTSNPSTHQENANVFDEIDEVNNVSWNGHDFNVELKNIAKADMINLANVTAFDTTTTGSPIAYAKADITVVHDIIAIGNGQPVTFGIKSNPSKREQKANVFDEIDNVNKVGWNGHNFEIQLEDVDVADMIDLADVVAFDITTIGGSIPFAKADITVNHDITTVGNDQPVTFGLTSNPSKREQKANVFDDIDEVNGVAWNSRDFNIMLKDVPTADMIQYAGVTAFNTSTVGAPKAYPKADITIDHTITAIGNGQPVIFGIKSNPSTRERKANVFDVYDTATNVGMNATNFTLPLTQVNEARYKEASGVNAWDAGDASDPQEIGLNTITVDPSYVFPTTAKVAHPVKFFTPGGTSIQVNATIIDTNINLDAHSISITLAEARAMDETTLLARTEATATSNNPGGAGTETITADSAAIQTINDLTTANTAGIPVTIIAKDTTPDETSLPIKVYVYDDIDIVNNIGWDGHDFDIKLADVAKADMIKYAVVTAFNITNEAAPVAYPKADVTVDYDITATGNGQVVTFGLRTNPSKRTQLANVFDDIDSFNRVGWNGHNFDLELRDVDTADMVALGNIEAFNTANVGKPVEYQKSDITTSHTIVTTGTKQPVTFGLKTNPSTHQQKANVFDDIDDINNVSWIGTDFNIELKAIMTADMIKYAGIAAFDTTVPGFAVEYPKAEITVDHDIVATGNGQPVTFGLKSNPSVREQKANVFDVFDPTRKVGMNATDFTLPLSQVSEARYKEASGVKAWSTLDASDPQEIGLNSITVDSSYAYPTAAKAAHPVKFFTPDGTSVQVNVTIITTNIDLDADSISITLAEAQSMTAKTLLAKSKALAISNNEGGAGTETVTVDSAAIQTLNDLKVANTAGVPVKITAKDATPDETSLTIKVYVYDDIDYDNQVGWDGHDFAIELGKVPTADMINYAGITAFDLTNEAAPSAYAKADITVVHDIVTTGNGQVVTFGLRGNPSKREQKANVFDALDEVNKVGWIGHNFDMKLADVTSADMIALAGVEAFDTSTEGLSVTYPKSSIKVNHTITTTGNAQPVTFSLTMNPSTHVQKANVFDAIDEVNKVGWSGHDFNIMLVNVPSADMIALAEITASDLSISGEPTGYAKADITVVHDIVTTGNGQVVTFGLRGNPSKREQKANVFDAIDTENNIAWTGHNFNIAKADANTVGFIQAGEVRAFEVNPDNTVTEIPTITSDPATLNVGNGQAVTFQAKASKRKYLANVFDAYNKDAQEGIIAHDFTVDVKDANETAYIAAADITVYDATNPSALVVIPDAKITVESTYTYPTKATAAHAAPFITDAGTKFDVKATITEQSIPTPNPDVYRIDAQNIEMSVSDYQEAMKTGAIEHKILTLSNAKAYNVTRQEEVNPIVIDTGALPQNVKENELLEIVLNYIGETEENSEETTRNTISETKDVKASKHISLQISTEKHATLPTTGEKVTEIVVYSLLVTGGSFIVIMFVLFYRKNKKSDEQ